MQRSTAKKIVIATAVCAVAIILLCFNPLEVSFYPRCPSKLLTGFDCPGCGTLRALHSLLNLKIADAWGYNPAIFFGIPAVAFFAFQKRYKPGSIAYRICTSRYTPWAIFIAVIAWWVGRNISL